MTINKLDYMIKVTDMVMFSKSIPEEPKQSSDLDEEEIMAIIEAVACDNLGSLEELTRLANLDKWDQVGSIMAALMKEGKEEIQNN